MNDEKVLIFTLFVCLVVLGLLLGCDKARKAAQNASNALQRRSTGAVHMRLKWRAENFFTDASVLKLCKAIEAKDLAEIDRLVKSGVDINAKGRGSMTPLLWAFPVGEEVFKKVLDLGGDPNVQLTEENLLLYPGESVMFAAVKCTDGVPHDDYLYDVPMGNYLGLVLNHGGNTKSINVNGETPVFTAIHCPPTIVGKISLLLRHGADINHRDKRGNTAARLATGEGSYLSALALLEAGADYRIPDRRGIDLVLTLAQRQLEWSNADMFNATGEGYQAKPLIDWLTAEGVNWDSAPKAVESPEARQRLKDLPGDYQHRPWLPQRPTLKRPDAK